MYGLGIGVRVRVELGFRGPSRCALRILYTISESDAYIRDWDWGS